MYVIIDKKSTQQMEIPVVLIFFSFFHIFNGKRKSVFDNKLKCLFKNKDDNPIGF
jgi:hypothetical protein